jgi:hypothetical protein
MISSAPPIDLMHEQLCRLMIQSAKCLFRRNLMRFGICPGVAQIDDVVTTALQA